MNRRVLAILFAAGWTAACSAPEQPSSNLSEAWDGENDPQRFSLEVKKLADLPTEGMLPDETYPWSDYYWATYSGGLSYRWQDHKNSSSYKDYLYDVLKPDALTSGSVDVARLSPAEKFDLYLNRYDFPLTRFEQDRTRKAVDPETDEVPRWFGLCHGWAPATLMEPEPGAVATVKNENGLEIPFYTSDIKALLTHIYAYNDADTRFVGERCNENENKIETDMFGRVKQKECRDTNPAVLHLALAEMLGNPDMAKREGFVADITFSAEVWNQAVIGYKVNSMEVKKYHRWLDKTRRHRAPGTKQLAKVELDLYYITEIAPHARPMKGAKDQYTRAEHLAYTLELDENGVIIGGEWDSETRPDFLWKLMHKPSGNNLIPYDAVHTLLNKSLGVEDNGADAEPTSPEAPAPGADDVPATDPAT